MADDALDELVALADQFLPNRSFPDKGVDLIEQSVAYALTHARKSVDVGTAREAVAALIGMPLDPTASLAALATELRDRALLDDAAGTALVARLGVSLRGLDARRERPDAVVLLCDGRPPPRVPWRRPWPASVFGRETAVIDIDLSGMTDDSSISTLLGSAPGLIGSDRPLPLHELRRSPWQVVVLRGIDSCAISIRDTIAAGLAAGSFTDAMGRRIPLGAAIVILDCTVGRDRGVTRRRPSCSAARLGAALIAACDVVTGTTSRAAADARTTWIRRWLLDPLAARLARAGYAVTFDPALGAWLDRHLPTDGSSPEGFLTSRSRRGSSPGSPWPAVRSKVGVADDQPAVLPEPEHEAGV